MFTAKTRSAVLSRDFPVVNDGALVGMLRRDDLLAGLQRGDATVVADVMQQNIRPVEESEALVSVLEVATPAGNDTLPVTSSGVLTGLLDLRQMFDLVKARASLDATPD